VRNGGRDGVPENLTRDENSGGEHLERETGVSETRGKGVGLSSYEGRGRRSREPSSLVSDGVHHPQNERGRRRGGRRGKHTTKKTQRSLCGDVSTLKMGPLRP